MIITATNGKQYEVRMDNDQNIEIERDDTITGLRKVFVFQDLSIGNFQDGRKEAIFYSYDIAPTNERINKQRHAFKDEGGEFANFLNSAAWQQIKNSLVIDFLAKIEWTEPV
jgi:hypothetical protein